MHSDMLRRNTINKLTNYVQEFRRAIDTASELEEFRWDSTFSLFPRRCCGDTCCLLGHYLLEKGIETEYIGGNYYGDDAGYGQSHAWLLFDGNIIIDITADQFWNNPIFLNYNIPVYIGESDDFHRLFEVDPRDVSDSIRICELGSACISRLSRIYSIIVSHMNL